VITEMNCAKVQQRRQKQLALGSQQSAKSKTSPLINADDTDQNPGLKN